MLYSQIERLLKENREGGEIVNILNGRKTTLIMKNIHWYDNLY